MTASNDSRMVRLPVRNMRDETKPQRAAQEGDLPPLPEPQTLITESDVGYRAYTDYQMREYARTAIAAAGGGVPQGTAEKADEMLLGIHQHLQEALRIPTMPWPDPGAHGHEATARAIHTSYCALRFKVMDAIAELTSARVELTGLLASSPQPEAAMTQQERDILQGMREIKDGKGTEAAQSPAEKERDAIAELNHQQWLALGQCAALVSACHRLSAESEEYDFDDGLGRGAQQSYWDEFDSALERASEALDQANKETQRIHATQFVQPSQPEAAPAVAQSKDQA